MASTFRLQSGWRYASVIVLAAGFGLTLVYTRTWKVGNEDRRETTRRSQIGILQRALVTNGVQCTPWGVLVSSAVKQGILGVPAPAAERFRLAGTFAVESATGVRIRRAILDDTLKNEQLIAGEGEALDDVTVVNIRYDRVTLRSATGTRELVLQFMTPNDSASSASNSLAKVAAATTNRFGCIKVQKGRWQFSRQPMLEYYQELLDEPDRMVALFDSMKPVRDGQNRITGYVVGLEGEQDFFDVVGLRAGDIVRSVNSVAMTNRRRAEFFIDEFLKNRMSAIVLDVERDGKVEKQVYQVRD